mmetsp:Transcript_149025/g.260430  ORF Transcript_149025/g.260430 Transcript_149025/m.260430 type:complete len:95 (-) Transcript_149025:8-292(-)
MNVPLNATIAIVSFDPNIIINNISRVRYLSVQSRGVAPMPLRTPPTSCLVAMNMAAGAGPKPILASAHTPGRGHMATTSSLVKSNASFLHPKSS